MNEIAAKQSMLRSPVVTVLLPVLNGGLDLSLAVRSILAQSFKRWELIIIDDGSSDGSLSRVSGIDQRVQILSDGRNLGLSARLNQGVSVAQGRYVARMDHDDVAHPERLARQVEFLDMRGETDLVGSRCIAISERDSVIGQLPVALTHDTITARPWLGFYLAHPTWMGKIEWFRRNPYKVPAPYRCEDQELLLRTYANSKFAALPQALLAYRVRERPALRTLLRTRASLLDVQLNYFVGRKRYLHAGMSTLAAAGRMGADLASPLVRRIVSPRGVLSLRNDSERVTWERLISQLRG